MKFSVAILKLTIFYVLVVMVISVAFSVAIYQISSNEIDRGLSRQNMVIENLPPRQNGQFLDNLESLRQQQLEDSSSRLEQNLIYFNLLILLLSSIASYFFARWTLRPLEEAMDEQNRFTADASHELKTPLAALRSEIEVNLRDKNLSVASSKKLLKSNLEEIEKLETLSTALLKLAKFDEVNKMEFAAVDLDQAVTEAYEKIESLAAAKKIEINAKLLPAKILGDKSALVELFVILLDNAVKYSPKNSKIKIKMKIEGRGISVSIKDQGEGIKSSDLPHIFDRFYRADFSRTKNQVDGYGLGLSIAKRIVELHEGKISATSELSHGSRFTLKFHLS